MTRAILVAMVLCAAGPASAQDADPGPLDLGPLELDPIWDRMFARFAVVDAGGGVLSVQPSASDVDPRPAFVARLTAVDRESNALQLHALRVAVTLASGLRRVAWHLVAVEEVVVGTGDEDGSCLPAVFVAWPQGGCRSDSGLFGFGVSVLEVDHDLDTGDLSARIVEGQLRLALPGEAHGPRYPLFRFPLWMGAALDWAGELVPRAAAGFELFGRWDHKHFETSLAASARPSMTRGFDDAVYEGRFRLAYQWIGPFGTVDRLTALALELGLAYATVPRTTVGQLLSRQEKLSAHVLLRLEVSVAALAGSSSAGAGYTR